MNEAGLSSWTKWVQDQSYAISKAGQWRSIKSFDALGPVGELLDHKKSDHKQEVVSFASNDYLGLSHHHEVIKAAHIALDRWGTGACASRLVVGTRPIHKELESALADWKESESAVVFPTGYSANLGVLTTFGRPGIRIFSDELNHASIVDGCRLSGAQIEVYKHNDFDHLDALLTQARREDCERTIVVSDTVFSMDGDIVELSELIECSRRHGSLLVLDEAHDVFGIDIDAVIDSKPVELLRVGTLSKTLGSLGGFIAGPKRFTELLINKARSFIFTTALTPSDTAAALAALRIVTSTEGERLKERLRDLINRVSPGNPSPIIPIILGSEKRAVQASEQLLEMGLWVPAIRPPTVPQGSSRLRIAISAAHQDDQIDQLVKALAILDIAQ